VKVAKKKKKPVDTTAEDEEDEDDGDEDNIPLSKAVGKIYVCLACPAEWWVAGVVICLERGADLHMVKLMPLPLTVSFFSKIQIGFTFLVPAHPGSPAQSTVKRVCVCVCVCVCVNFPAA